MLKTFLAVVLMAGGSTAASNDEINPHARAPHNVVLTIHEGTQLLAADADDGHDPEDDYAPTFFGRLSEQFPTRFSQNADGIWVDAFGVYVFDEDEECYWENVTAAQLTRGRRDYVQFCSSCHGMDGLGYGRSAQALRPPPRDFSQGLFKFTKVDSEKLPADDALLALIKAGLDGTPMYEWDISDERLADILIYIKSLSEEDTGWRDPTNQIADVIATGDDPWSGREAKAVTEGQRLYHLYQCYTCHPGYGTPAQINAWRGVEASTTYPDDLTFPKLRLDSSFKVRGYPVAILPPDFTWQDMRRGRTARDVFQTIAAGVGGAGMPTWKGAMPDEEIWAISHYVRSLVDTYKDQPGRAAFMATLRGE
jgi:mono/diheme cytochrome c family protein